MKRFLVGVGALVLLAASSSVSPEISEIADQLELRHYYLDEGVEVDINDMERLVAAYQDVSFVGLAGDWQQGSDALAEDLQVALGGGTFFVRSPSEIGAVSSRYDDASLNRALDAVVATRGSDYRTDFEEFAAALGEAPAGPPWGTITLAVLAGLAGFFIWRGRRRRALEADYRLEQARAEIRSQMDEVANQILQLADAPRLDDHQEARDHYRAASEIFQAIEGRFAGVADLAVLETISDDLDRARWELEVALALLDGRTPPEKPTEEAPHCFFDPTHGAGTEQAELETPAGKRSAWVCRDDAAKLRRGDAPEPRTISMGTTDVPAPRAPRSHGGMGLDSLDVFSVIVGGMGTGVPYNWTGRHPPAPPSRPRRRTQPSSAPPRPKGRARRRL